MKTENIKFKAKELGTGKWKEGFLQRDMDYNLCILIAKKEEHSWYWTQIDPSTVCQFTGQTDCEGNEVWEGDLLQSQITESIYEIVWHKFLGFIMKNPRSGGHLSETLGCLLQLGKFKVIGNKFDNDK